MQKQTPSPFFIKSNNLYGIRPISISQRRCRAEIARDVLIIINLNPGLKMSLLGHLVGVNHQKLNTFIRPLLAEGYLSEVRTGRTRLFYICEDGKEFLITLEGVCAIIGMRAGGEAQ